MTVRLKEMSLDHLSAVQTAMQMVLMKEKHLEQMSAMNWACLTGMLKDMSLACLLDCSMAMQMDLMKEQHSEQRMEMSWEKLME